VRYQLDPDRSRLMVHATSSVHPIDTDAPITGWLDVALDDDGGLDADARVDGVVEVDLSTMRSGNPLIDREAERRLHIRRYPVVTATLTALTPLDDGYAGVGTLDFHGVTRPLAGVLHVSVDDVGTLTLTGSTELDVTEFGVQPPSLLLIKVHQQIRVELRAVANPG
jgi:polyisoprenoid-binding protein YceI